MIVLELPRDVDEVRELLLGRRVTAIDDETLTLDDGRVLRVEGNLGCGGCTSGHYRITALNACPINAIMDVVLIENDRPGVWEEETVYRLFVLAQDERIELVTCEGTDGNGYYGTGFFIEVSSKPTT